ncbi:MAG: exodeoxyribonuclease III [Bacteroidia bacterium]|nr:exodeoxyribonuclease III [Bacteroidia bacterium]MCZ2278125.1 exodeoxyribonuclease III [Bacteroidia bacterium]
MRIISWNVNGLRAIWKKGFPEWLARVKPDILCLQEIKAQQDQLTDEMIHFNNYRSYFFSAEKKGYSGVAVYSLHKPKRAKAGLGLPEFDSEGRFIELEFDNFILFNIYFPNGGRGPERVKYKLDFYAEVFKRAEKLRKSQPNLIICGDYNTAHKEIDLARPKENSRVTGFLPEERAWIDQIVEMGYVDIFREFNQEPEQYTYWDQITRARERNVGWRIDYFMVTKEMKHKIEGASIQQDVMGSDHCPVEIRLKA